jgi:hypothetical protein
MGDSSTLPRTNKFWCNGFKGKVMFGIIFNWQSKKRSLIPQDVTVNNRRYEEVHNQFLKSNSSEIP